MSLVLLKHTPCFWIVVDIVGISPKDLKLWYPTTNKPQLCLKYSNCGHFCYLLEPPGLKLHLLTPHPLHSLHPMPMLSQPKQRAVDFPLFQPLFGAKDHWDWDKRSPQSRSFKHPSSLAPIKLLGIYRIYIQFEDACGLVGLVDLNHENKMMQNFS